MNKAAGLVFFLVIVFGLAAAGGVGAAEQARLEGRWEGAILFEEGRTELDMVAVFERSADGEWAAVLDLPLVGVRDLQVPEIEVTDGGIDLSFGLEDGRGLRTITAHLADEDTIEGRFEQGSQSYPVHLERRDPPGEVEEAEVIELPPPGTDELRERFNAQRGAVRLVLLLAPS